ncbi:AlpA family transcriptional regulator [Halomonas denitrificans]|nr:AlpA family transcriptional regulator [Halomonas denitrificans]
MNSDYRSYLNVTADAVSTDRMVLEPECKEISSLSRQRRWQLEREGRFPKRIKLGERTNAWLMSELMAWLNAASATRQI